MDEDPRIAPLLEWNRLARENTENAIVSSMFETAALSSEPIDNFSTWLLIGSASIASFLIVNIEKVLPFVGQAGFLASGAFLWVSCVLGLLSKIYAVRCKVAGEIAQSVRETFQAHLRAYEQEEERIQEGAKFWGITLQSGVRIERILPEFLAPLPKPFRWLAMRQLRKDERNPQIGYLYRFRALMKQSALAFFQSLAFLGFLATAFVCAAMR